MNSLSPRTPHRSQPISSSWRRLQVLLVVSTMSSCLFGATFTVLLPQQQSANIEAGVVVDALGSRTREPVNTSDKPNRRVVVIDNLFSDPGTVPCMLAEVLALPANRLQYVTILSTAPLRLSHTRELPLPKGQLTVITDRLSAIKDLESACLLQSGKPKSIRPRPAPIVMWLLERRLASVVEFVSSSPAPAQIFWLSDYFQWFDVRIEQGYGDFTRQSRKSPNQRYIFEETTLMGGNPSATVFPILFVRTGKHKQIPFPGSQRC